MEFTRQGLPIPGLEDISSSFGFEECPAGVRCETVSSKWQDALETVADDLGHDSWEEMTRSAWRYSPESMELCTNMSGIPLVVKVRRLIQGDTLLDVPIEGLICADLDGDGVAKNVTLTLVNNVFAPAHHEDELWSFGTAVTSGDILMIGQSLIGLVNPVLARNRSHIEALAHDDIGLSIHDLPGGDVSPLELENFNSILEEILKT
jgi:hypothetical protein